MLTSMFLLKKKVFLIFILNCLFNMKNFILFINWMGIFKAIIL